MTLNGKTFQIFLLNQVGDSSYFQQHISWNTQRLYVLMISTLFFTQKQVYILLYMLVLFCFLVLGATVLHIE